MRNIYTIGHSTHTQERLADLLRLQGITAVADVRSQPYSRLNPQFNREVIKDFLNRIGIAYVFLGKELGARSKDPNCYENGVVQYDRLEHTALFHEGIHRLEEGEENFRIAIMCAEREPLECHRTILVARFLYDHGWKVHHIHAGGNIEEHADAEERLIRMHRIPSMFMTLDDRRCEAYRRQAEIIAYNLPSEDQEASNTLAR